MIEVALLLAALFYYIISPLWVWCATRLPAHPAFGPLDLNTLPHDVRAHLEASVSALERCGFERVAAARAAGAGTREMRCALLLMSRTTGDRACVVTSLVQSAGHANYRRGYVTIIRPQQDGSVLRTSNKRAGGALPGRSLRAAYRFPNMLDVERLVRAHERLAARLGPQSARAALPPTGREAEALSTEMADEVKFEAEQERMRWSAGSDTFRFTLVGAYLATWAQLPPIRQIIEARRVKEAGRLLKDLGV